MLYIDSRKVLFCTIIWTIHDILQSLTFYISDNITNKVINDNVGELFEDLRPVLEEVITKILEDLILKALESQIPFDKLYAKE